MKRILLYDNIKGFLILLVVLGHILNICGSYYNYSSSWYKIFTFFMMPLFLFIMGKFSCKSKKCSSYKARKMLKIFIIMQIITTIYYAFCLNIISLNKSLFTPRFTLWYLLTCVYYYLSDYILKKISFKKAFIISMFLALFSGFIPFITNAFSITRTIGFYPFYVLGFYESKLNLETKILKYRKIFIFLGIFITIWFIFNQNFFLAKDMYLKYNYYTYNTVFECFYKRVILYIIFFIYSGFIYCIFPRGKTIFTKLGDKTMLIYLSHGILLKTMEKYNLFILNSILGTFITYVAVIFLGFIIHWIINLLNRKEDDMIERKNIIRNASIQVQ